jgi:hypothetical protein
MEVITIDSEAFKKIMEALAEVKKGLVEKATPKLEEMWLDNEDVSKILRVTDRTLQNYRDRRVIPFSQFGNKIYYKASDIEAHLEKHKISKRQIDSYGK